VVFNENDKFYDVIPGFNATQPGTKNIFIEKSNRKNDSQTEYPGPGMYDISLKDKREGITMGAKPKKKDEPSRAPGPGAYKPSWDEASINYTYDIKMGKAERLPEEKHSDYPGPGFYKPVLPWDKGPVIGTGDRSKTIANETPGPSYYDLPTMVPVIYSVNKPNVVP
jgi:hypothetical protein